MSESQASKFWLDLVVEDIIKKYPKGEIIVSSGISPSADYHIGHFREILTADAITWGLKKAGRTAKHIHVVDNFDPLRKRYEWLPKSFERYVGHPICLIPDPKGNCHKTYADHFYSEFEIYIKAMGIHPERVVRSYEDLYKSGLMAPQIEKVLVHIEKVKRIFQEVANRALPEDWTPVQIIDEKGRLTNATLSSWDKSKTSLGGVNYSQGGAKLNWRLDWPARWQLLGVMVEPYGRELASSGSARDTGVAFAKAVFGFKPPLAGAEYEPIHLAGDTKKMSSSLGNLVTPKDALAIMPPEILRYFVVRSRPDHKLHFDSGNGLYNLIDEFSQVEVRGDHPFRDAYDFAVDVKSSKRTRTVSTVPFKHLVSVYQTAMDNPKRTLEILQETGYDTTVKKEQPIISAELDYVSNWLGKYAPDEVKFTIQKSLPKVKLTALQKQLLTQLAEAIADQKKLEAQLVHENIYQLANELKLKPAEAFQAIYKVILGKDYGPKAGWFLSSLDKNWLVKRLRLEG